MVKTALFLDDFPHFQTCLAVTSSGKFLIKFTLGPPSLLQLSGRQVMKYKNSPALASCSARSFFTCFIPWTPQDTDHTVTHCHTLINLQETSHSTDGIQHLHPENKTQMPKVERCDLAQEFETLKTI